ncbi:MAG TPA: hypothetical protein PK961_12880 [bacterium]|nr:hypothetical protein [bacterium]
MRPGRLLGFGFAAIFLFLGLIFLLSLGSQYNTNKGSDALVGLVLTALGVGLLVLTLKFLPAVKVEHTVVQKIDLAGDTELEKLKCQSCGAPLPGQAIRVAPDGSVLVTCPYCDTSYQITEQPKW